jgi:hypothetical protein
MAEEPPFGPFILWFLTPITDTRGILLRLGLLFVVSFFISRLVIYVWVKRTRCQSPRFSPTAASVMSAPLLVAAFLGVIFIRVHDFTLQSIVLELPVLALLFAPILLILSPLLAMYLIGACRQQQLPSSALLCATSVACLALQALWLGYLLDDRH